MIVLRQGLAKAEELGGLVEIGGMGVVGGVGGLGFVVDPVPEPVLGLFDPKAYELLETILKVKTNKM